VTFETLAGETPDLTAQERGKLFDMTVSRGKDLRDANLRRAIELRSDLKIDTIDNPTIARIIVSHQKPLEIKEGEMVEPIGADIELSWAH
jgi:hypothetical protein